MEFEGFGQTSFPIEGEKDHHGRHGLAHEEGAGSAGGCRRLRGARSPHWATLSRGPGSRGPREAGRAGLSPGRGGGTGGMCGRMPTPSAGTGGLPWGRMTAPRGE